MEKRLGPRLYTWCRGKGNGLPVRVLHISMVSSRVNYVHLKDSKRRGSSLHVPAMWSIGLKAS